MSDSYGILIRIEFDIGCVRHIDPHVHMWGAAEIPDKRRAFESPVVPNAVVAEIALLVKSQAACVQAALDLYLKDHPEPEELEYYLCGPPQMLDAIKDMLDNLGVPVENIAYDEF